MQSFVLIHFFYENLLNAGILGVSLAIQGCAGQPHREVGSHIPELESRDFLQSLKSVPGPISEVPDPQIDQTLQSLFEIYGGAAQRIVEFCLNETIVEGEMRANKNECPAISSTIDVWEYWRLGTIDELDDIAWCGTDKNGARKCNKVFHACLQQELVNPTSLRVLPQNPTPSQNPSPLPQAPEKIKFTSPFTEFDTLSVVFARNDAWNDPNRGPQFVEKCFDEAKQKLSPASQEILDAKRTKNPRDLLFWVYPQNDTSKKFILGNQQTWIFAQNFKDCLNQ